jgi:hypothetical protein
MDLSVAAATYRAIRDRIWEEDPKIDEQTLADLHEIVAAVIRSARLTASDPLPCELPIVTEIATDPERGFVE